MDPWRDQLPEVGALYSHKKNWEKWEKLLKMLQSQELLHPTHFSFQLSNTARANSKQIPGGSLTMKELLGVPNSQGLLIPAGSCSRSLELQKSWDAATV